MGSRSGRRLYHCTDVALVRSAHHVDALPPWPDLTRGASTDVEQWLEWLRAVWASDEVSEAVEFASPVFARQVTAVCAGKDLGRLQVRRLVLSMMKYLLRMMCRATPFGLFAGVALASFGRTLTVHSGTDHRATTQVDAGWLAEVIADLESRPELLGRLLLVANNMCIVRGDRLVVPHPAQSGVQAASAIFEVSMRYTPVVRLVAETARRPIRGDEVASKLAAEFPTATPARISGLLAELVKRRVLLSSLQTPSTIIDPLGRLISELETEDVADVPHLLEVLDGLRAIDRSLKRHNHADGLTPTDRRAIRRAVAKQVSAVRATTGPPLAIDLRVDCRMVLPQQVSWEAEAAASALARLSAHPFGTPAWQSYHTRFFERYGIGALVPVLDVVDPDVGIGYPAGYLGCEPEPHPALSVRDQRLLTMAQTAAMDGRNEVVLDDAAIDSLAIGEDERVGVPPHLELCFQVQAKTAAALQRGDFTLTVVGVSRGVGTMTGRFIDLLEPSDQQRIANLFAQLPSSDPDAALVQLSFPPLASGDAHVARAPRLLSMVISLSEHSGPNQSAIELGDVAVGCDSHRLYLASLSLQRRLEPIALHALDLRTHTSPMARFLAEIGTAQAPVVSGFDWGAAASMPFLPQLWHGRVILFPARWRLDHADLPGPDTSWPDWDVAFAAYRMHRRLPSLVYLTERDRRLRLDLDETAELVLLRDHLDSAGHVVLTEAPAQGAADWLDGRAHEIVVPLVTARAARWPKVPSVSSVRVTGRGHGHLPGASAWLYAKLYSRVPRQTEILMHHLPELLSRWSESGDQPSWWFIRYQDPDPHLRLRIAIPDAAAFGSAVGRLSIWADDLRHQGLLRDIQFATSYPETGRWGNGALMSAAEEVFCADSRALVAQLSQLSQTSWPDPQVVVVANLVAMTVGFSGSIQAGMTWLMDHAKPTPHPGKSASLPRAVSADAIRLADPTDDWAALRASPVGNALIESWQSRHRALSAYRALLSEAAVDEGLDPDSVLDALLHAHHIRAVGIDRDHERACLRLARATALAWQALHARNEPPTRTFGGGQG